MHQIEKLVNQPRDSSRAERRVAPCARPLDIHHPVMEALHLAAAAIPATPVATPLAATAAAQTPPRGPAAVLVAGAGNAVAGHDGFVVHVELDV